jgi:signal transduction histidine kinase
MGVQSLWKSSRALLWAGFGGLLSIIILTGWQGSLALSSIESDSNGLRTEYLQRDDLLNGIRFSLSKSAIDIRDYLLDPDQSAVIQRRADLEALRGRVTDAAERYRRDLPADEVPLWAQLTGDIHAYWAVLEPAFHWDERERKQRGEEFLHDQIIPRQGELFDLTSAVNGVNLHNVQRANQRIEALFRQLRVGLVTSEVLALVLGTLLALLTISRILALERASKSQLREVTGARLEMQSLSHRLVAAQEEERRRVARELHDEVGQALSAVLVELGRLEGRIPVQSQESRVMLSVARELADRATSQVRDMALLLRPSMLDDLGLVPALQWQAREVSRRTGVKVKVAAESVADDIPDEYRTCVYRIVQEAVNNAARHAHASVVRVAARQENNQIRVLVQDDGIGFDPSVEKGMGLLGMEERVKKLGGVFRVDSEKGGGTIVSALLPLAQPEMKGGG